MSQGGAPTAIGANAASAGRLNINGTNNAGITIYMTTLPTVLLNGVTPLGVSAYEYCYVQSAAAQVSCVPASTTTGSIVSGQTLSSGGAGFLFLGATLAGPSAGQATGAYTANLTITVTEP